MNNLATLKELFGQDDVRWTSQGLQAGPRLYPVVDDVVILLPPHQWTPFVRQRLSAGQPPAPAGGPGFAADIQRTFGEEWKKYGNLLPEHAEEFKRYFDLLDLKSLQNKRVCDLGCGIGRWALPLSRHCREIVLVDFSDAIFVARRNLAGIPNALFFMGDLRGLPFKNDFCDFIYSLGVLHHLEEPCLGVVRSLKPRAPQLLVFLYYDLDNRPRYFRWILAGVTLLRRVLCRIKCGWFRAAFSFLTAVLIYKPLVGMGHVLSVVGWGSAVPLFDFYRGKSLRRVEQDVYDRFFTRVEQRVSRKDILSLADTFSQVTVSDSLPYWHFLCRR